MLERKRIQTVRGRHEVPSINWEHRDIGQKKEAGTIFEKELSLGSNVGHVVRLSLS